MKSTTLRIGLLVLVAGLALTGLGGAALAAGDLFDKSYTDCPHKTRLRDGQIDNLAVNRDAKEADEVNVSWESTDPATWGLGANAYRTTLVVILDDGQGDDEVKSTSLGTRSIKFDEVAKGTEIEVQLAIVTETPDGKYLISDIHSSAINQSLSKPLFYSTFKGSYVTVAAAAPDTAQQIETKDIGKFYFIGYNENFHNYKADGLTTRPSTPRLRIGLRHGGESDKAREDVDFDHYIIRIEDEDKDVVSEGDDVSTVETTPKFLISVFGIIRPVFQGVDVGTVLSGLAASSRYNVRVNAGGKITPSIYNQSLGEGVEQPQVLPFGRGLAYNEHALASQATLKAEIVDGAVVVGVLGNQLNVGRFYAAAQQEHRDFPIDTLNSDETYTISAWAVDEDDHVISPVQTLEVRPTDTRTSITTIADYLNVSPGVPVTNVYLTTFTVLE